MVYEINLILFYHPLFNAGEILIVCLQFYKMCDTINLQVRQEVRARVGFGGLFIRTTLLKDRVPQAAPKTRGKSSHFRAQKNTDLREPGYQTHTVQ